MKINILRLTGQINHREDNQVPICEDEGFKGEVKWLVFMRVEDK